MGADLQKGTQLHQSTTITFDCDIPQSLRPLYPFLSEAKKSFMSSQKSASPSARDSFKRMAIGCVGHALKLLSYLSIDLDKAAIQCIELFLAARTEACIELNLPEEGVMTLDTYNSLKLSNTKRYQAYDIIIAEADEILALAEEQIQEGFKFDAMLNYHAASIYYRVMLSMLPHVMEPVYQRLMYAVWKTKLYCEVNDNFAVEHFTGDSCSEQYEIHGSSKLGKGSYGSVYLATHRITGDECAVKVMNVDKVTSYYLRKLHTEIAILKSVDHPNIIKLHDVFFGKRSVYLVTDLCRGGELFELLNSGKSQGFVFREDRASKLMRDMISAVHYLHGKGIVHRDLKLENFLFQVKTSSSPLIMIDFGLSKHFDKGELLNQRVGSCYYTAPEVFSGNYDYRCDIWSLGVLCYMLLSGTPPFFGKTVDDVYEATLHQEPSFPDKKFRHLSPACMDFMHKLLVKDPTCRMSTSHALSHPFITGIANMPSVTLSPSNTNEMFQSVVADNILDSMLIFYHSNPLTRLVMRMASHTLSPDVYDDLRQEFQFIDKLKTGSIQLNEFVHCFSLSSYVVSGRIDLISLYDSIALGKAHDHQQAMSYHEYISAAMIKRVKIDENRIRIIFAMLDPNKTGYISCDSIRKCLGDDLSQTELSNMIAAGDADRRQGIISINKFLRLWYKVTSTTSDWNSSSDSEENSKDDDRMDI